MRILGPVFWYDLVRVARRQRLALWRASYGLALLAALFLLYTSVLPHAWLGGTSVKPGDAAAFAGYFFAVFVVLQFAAVTLLTPALTAGALAEERSRNTLLFLLTTQLTNREIVLGKLGTRLLQVGLLVLTGLPVLGFLQFMGGVEPLLVVASFIALIPLALSLGGLGLACAVFATNPQNAAWRAYQLLFVYAALSMFSILYLGLPIGTGPAALAGANRFFTLPGQMVRRVAPPQTPFLALAVAADILNYPNPYYAYLRLKFDQDAGILLADSLPVVLGTYAIGHALFALVFVGLATAHLRAASAKRSSGLTYKKAIILRAAAHPPVKDRPVLWKEVYCEAKPRQRWLALFFSRWFFFSAFMPAAFVLSLVSRYAGPLVAFGLCLRVTLHAARTIGLERDRQTLDSLLTTDLTPSEIVRDKWWGSYLIGRWGLLWLIAHWGLAVAIYALTPLAVPLLLTEVLIYGAFFVSLGLFFGAYCSTTRQAAMAALVIGLFATTLLPWAGGQLLTALLPNDLVLQQQKGSFRYVPGVSREAWPENLAKGLMPAWAMYESVIPNSAYGDYWFAGHQSRFYALWPFVVVGLAVYGTAAVVLARLAAARFRREVRGGPQRAAPHPTAQRPAVAQAVSIPVGGVP